MPTVSGSVPAATDAGTPAAGATPTAKPTDASDVNWITAQIQQQFTATGLLERRPEERAAGTAGDDLAKPFVTCSDDGLAKYILGPAEVLGTERQDRHRRDRADQPGQPDQQWEVQLKFTGKGAKKFATVTTRLFSIPQTESRNQFAIVLDGQVISAPRTLGAITGGHAQITGNFTQASRAAAGEPAEVRRAADLVPGRDRGRRSGAPLGDEQLQRGLLAGLIGLLLVVIYSLLQYRALGLVTIFSLVTAGVLTYGCRGAARLAAGLPAQPGRRGRPDRRDRHHRRLVHRLLRTDPGRGP